MKPTDLALHLTAFLGEYLPAQRNVSAHTVRAYRDAFTLLLRYCRDYRALPTQRLRLEDLDASLVLDFLDYVVRERGCGPRTRNLRLTAVQSFFRYLQTEEPGRMAHSQRILAIPHQRCPQPTVDYLSVDDLAAILAQPDLSSTGGFRDAVLLTVLYDTGARVQELIDLSVGDVRLEAPAQARLFGKGRKTRVVPLLTRTADLLGEYIQRHELGRPEELRHPVFRNRSGGRLSRSGIRYILEKHSAAARSHRPSVPLRVTPHTFRHTKAMHLLQAGNPAVIIRDILGHVDIRSTAIYARADLETMRRALEKAAGPATTPACKPSWQTNRDLLSWLRQL